MNDERKARQLLKQLKEARHVSYDADVGDYTLDNPGDVIDIKSQLNGLPHVPNKKEAKIIRRLKQQHHIKTTEEVYEKFGKVIAKELAKET